MKARYVVAHADESEVLGQYLFSTAGSQPFKPGWYRIVVDEEGRQAFEAGPFDTAKEARLADRGTGSALTVNAAQE